MPTLDDLDLLARAIRQLPESERAAAARAAGRLVAARLLGDHLTRDDDLRRLFPAEPVADDDPSLPADGTPRQVGPPEA